MMVRRTQTEGEKATREQWIRRSNEACSIPWACIRLTRTNDHTTKNIHMCWCVCISSITNESFIFCTIHFLTGRHDGWLGQWRFECHVRSREWGWGQFGRRCCYLFFCFFPSGFVWHEGNDGIPYNIQYIDCQHPIRDGQITKTNNFDWQQEQTRQPTGFECSTNVSFVLLSQLRKGISLQQSRNPKRTRDKDTIEE